MLAGEEFPPGQRLDLGPVGAKCEKSGAAAHALGTEMILQCFATDGTGDLAIRCAGREQHDVPHLVVSPGRIGKADGRLLGHPQGVEDRQHAGQLDVLVAGLEAGDGRRADVGDGG